MDYKAKRQARTLKDALYVTIHQNKKLSIEAIAEQLDMAPSYLYRSALPDMDIDGDKASGVRFPLKQLIPLIRATGDFQVLDLIEHTLGRAAVPLPVVTAKKTTDVRRQAMQAVVRFGELMKVLDESLDDEHMSLEEQEVVNKGGRDAIQSIMLLLTTYED